MTTRFAQSLAGELRRNADSISQTFAQCEQTCLDVGARLGEAIPGLGDLAALFEALSQSLEGEEIRAAGVDLEAIARELTQAADELTSETGALTDLVGLNRAIALQISKLLASIRTINALVFNVKIEAASLSESGDDMTVFADGLQQLARSAQRALDEYQTTHGKLFELLRASSDAQVGFQRSHQDDLRSISSEIAESLGTVAQRRREIVAALHEIGAQSQQIGAQIGSCVVALQVGDSTRQRIEHVQSALNLSADHLDGEAAASEDEGERVAGRICRLQALQLDGALDEFTREMDTISVSLKSVAKEAGALAGRGRSLFGSSGPEGGSFLEALERKLGAARAIVDECRRARAIVDRAAAAVGTTMADLQTRTEGLSQIVVDVTIIGTNAVLRSSRLGDRGKGLNIIAQELRNYGARIVEGINELPPALREVVAFVERFSEAGSTHDSQRLARLDERMTAAIGAFNANGKQMTAALEKLGGESESVHGLLEKAVGMLAAHEDVGAILKDAAAAVDAFSARMNGADEEAPAVDAVLDALLRPRYTMASERDIHDAFTGNLGDFAASEAAPEVEELAQACLF